MIPCPILGGSRQQFTWELTISADAADVVLKDLLEALYGGMAGPTEAIVTIATDVEIYSTNPSFPALDTGVGWPSGSKLKIINNGKIYGCGGVGASFNGPGTVGGDAIFTRMNVTIDNTNGLIFGGGGGGGPGGSLEYRKGWVDSFWYYWQEGDPLNDPQPNSSGAGGGGQGRVSYGGTGNTADGASNGNAGSTSGPGTGVGGVNDGMGGGTGGAWGSSGSKGNDNGTSPDSWDHSEAGSGKHWRVGGRYAAGNGYAGGRAVRKGNKSVTWLGGNNATQVKGAVS